LLWARYGRRWEWFDVPAVFEIIFGMAADDASSGRAGADLASRGGEEDFFGMESRKSLTLLAG